MDIVFYLSRRLLVQPCLTYTLCLCKSGFQPDKKSYVGRGRHACPEAVTTAAQERRRESREGDPDGIVLKIKLAASG